MTTMHHTDQEYSGKLADMRSNILQMAGLVEEMIGGAVEALIDRNTDKAAEVIAMDARVNALELDIDELGVTILARWQPMASDLRFVTLAFKMVTDLERIGDLAVNISERTDDLSQAQETWRMDEVAKMSEIARRMTHDAVDAFLEGDAERATRVIEKDDEVDALYARSFQSILQVMINHPDRVHTGVHALSVVKWLERIADHATNLAEQVIFMVNGKDIRHSGKLAG